MAQELYDQRIHSIDDICWTLGSVPPDAVSGDQCAKMEERTRTGMYSFVCMVDLAQDVGIVRIEDGILPFDQFGVL